MSTKVDKTYTERRYLAGGKSNRTKRNNSRRARRTCATERKITAFRVTSNSQNHFKTKSIPQVTMEVKIENYQNVETKVREEKSDEDPLEGVRGG